MALVDIAHGKSRHVHYRDSKLTFLLRVRGPFSNVTLSCSQPVAHKLPTVSVCTCTRLQALLLVSCDTGPLQDSLGGNAKTNLVANVHPSARYVQEICMVM